MAASISALCISIGKTACHHHDFIATLLSRKPGLIPCDFCADIRHTKGSGVDLLRHAGAQ